VFAPVEKEGEPPTRWTSFERKLKEYFPDAAGIAISFIPIVGGPIQSVIGSVCNKKEFERLWQAIADITTRVAQLDDDERERLAADEAQTLIKNIFQASIDEPLSGKRRAYVELLFDMVRRRSNKGGSDLQQDRRRPPSW
jgi:hypothetical protein